MPPLFSSMTSLVAAQKLNYQMGLCATDDPFGRLAALISQVTILQSNMTLIQSAIVSANASGASFSAFSTATFTTFQTVSNFAST